MQSQRYIFLLLCVFTFESIFPNETWESSSIDLGNGNDMFYIYYKARFPIKGNQTPLIMWLQGGPGCSSLFGLFAENGPDVILQNLSYVYNSYSWNNNSDVIYVDSPIGTGFSRAANKSYLCQEENCVSRMLYSFMINFFHRHPDLIQRPFYLFGECYAGHFIPSFSSYLIRSNNSLFNYKGFGLGNGDIDAYHQIGVYPKFLYENGRINIFQFLFMQIFSIICRTDLFIKPFNFTPNCDTFMYEYMLDVAKIVNDYNIMINYTYDAQDAMILKFVNSPEVLDELGLKDRKWNDCDDDVYNAFQDDLYRSYKSGIEYTLNHNYKVLIYAGEYDFICNWEASREFIKFLDWNGKKEFNKRKPKPWMIGSVESGQYVSYENLMFLRIHWAGHMVPMDKPKEALYMVNQFIEVL